MKTYIERVICFNGGLIAFFFGTNSEIMKFVQALAIMMCFDILTGILRSIYCKDMSIQSHKFEIGFLKKITMLCGVSVCYFIDKFAILNVGVSLESACAMAFIIGEIISIVENLDDMGIQLPQALRDKLFANKGSEASGK